MKRKIVALFFLLAFLIMPMNVSASSEAYRIKNYHFDVEVLTNGEYKIVETIQVLFNLPSRGIYRNLISRSIINWGELVPGEKEVSEEYYLPIKNIKVNNHETSIEYFSDGVSIRIGDPNVYLNGEVDYKISYTMVSQPLRHEELGQLLYLNLNGIDWDVYVDQFTFSVVYPKPVNKTEFLVYVGKGGSSNTSRTHCIFDNESTKVNCEVIGGLSPYENVTLLQKLAVDDSYLSFPSNNKFYLGVSSISLALFLMVVINFFKYGKDEPLIKTIEFGPPVGLNSAEVGFVYDDKADNKDIISLILEWAKDGYLIINEEDSVVSFKKVRDLTGR